MCAHVCCCFFFVFLSEQLAGVHSTTLNTLPYGTFDLDEMESKIRHGYPKPLYARSRLICLENTHNIMGGCALPLTFLQEVCGRACGWLESVCFSRATNISWHTNIARPALSINLAECEQVHPPFTLTNVHKCLQNFPVSAGMLHHFGKGCRHTNDCKSAEASSRLIFPV